MSEDQRRVCGSEVQIFTVSLNGANILSTLIHSPLLAFFPVCRIASPGTHATWQPPDCFNALYDQDCSLTSYGCTRG